MHKINNDIMIFKNLVNTQGRIVPANFLVSVNAHYHCVISSAVIDEKKNHLLLFHLDAQQDSGDRPCLRAAQWCCWLSYWQQHRWVSGLLHANLELSKHHDALVQKNPSNIINGQIILSCGKPISEIRNWKIIIMLFTKECLVFIQKLFL